MISWAGIVYFADSSCNAFIVYASASLHVFRAGTEMLTVHLHKKRVATVHVANASSTRSRRRPANVSRHTTF